VYKEEQHQSTSAVSLLPVSVFVICQFWGVANDVSVKLHMTTSICCWFIKICQKI